MRGSHFLNVVARPRRDARAGARAHVVVAADLAREYPATNQRIDVVVVPVREDALGDTETELLVLMAAAGCVLLMACANLASLLLSRAVGRRG